jgi:DinB superfamily
MDPNRKRWNEGQKLLRQALAQPSEAAIVLFLDQHAMLHTAEMSRTNSYSFADGLWQGTSETVIRCLPPKFEHSIAWLVWHMARIEDMTMNVLLAGKTQVFHQENWPARLKVSLQHTGNVVMTEADVTAFSQAIDIGQLKAYRMAVGRSTREVVRAMRPKEFGQKVDPVRLQGLLEDGSVAREAIGLIEYWGSLTKAGLLLMPPTRHNFAHLNEAMKVKQKCNRLQS